MYVYMYIYIYNIIQYIYIYGGFHQWGASQNGGFVRKLQ